MNWIRAEKDQENELKTELPYNWLHIYYFEALSILFRIENALRLIVYIVLKEEFYDKWINISIISDDVSEGTINSIAKKRLSQDQTFGYLGYSPSCPIMHLTSGELIRLITSESYWKLFKKYFQGNKEIIRNKLDEIGNIRNALAHFRPIKEDDVELIKQNAKHTLSKIEIILQDLLSCNDIVPTNTEHDWYKALRTSGSESCILGFKQSKDENWIDLIIKYNAPIIKTNKVSESSFGITLLNLKSSSILDLNPNFTKYLISLMYVKFTNFNPDSLQFSKNLFFKFSAKTLTKYYNEIKIEIEKILSTVSNEIELVKEDNLARGKLIEPIILVGRKPKNATYWDINDNILDDKVKEDSPPEFWGRQYYVFNDFISSTDRFPWMQNDFSPDISLPF